MQPAQQGQPDQKYTFRKWLFLSLLWLSLLLASLFWNISLFNGSIEHLALSEARSHLSRDLFYLRWASSHGGVYVPETDNTASNPYLQPPVLTAAGARLVLINPADMVRQAGKLSAGSGSETLSHIISLDSIHPFNAPDAWEAASLKRLSRDSQEYSAIERINQKPYLRFMGALMIEKSCLSCHREQGYREGDVRGGISVSVSLERFERIESVHRRSLYFWHVLIGLLGLAGITAGLIRLSRGETEKRADEMKLVRYADRHSLLQNIGEGVYGLNDRGECTVINPAALEMLGYSEEEVVGVNAHKLFHHHHPDGREFMASDCGIYKAITEHQRQEGEATFFRKNGEMFTVFYVATPVVSLFDRQEFVVVVGFQDITSRKMAEEEIRRLAFYDTLTGLANRRLLTDRMEQALAHARRSSELVAVCMIDLDGFKQVNDLLGHKNGDQLLVEVARRLQECIRQADTASRFGGDEFALILAGFKKISECEQSLNRIIASLGAPYSVGGAIAHVTASIGATIFPNDGGTADILLRHADQAMYSAKQAGKNCYRLFNPSQHNQQMANQATLKKIEHALNTGQLMLFYQPQVDCRRGVVIGAEALIRWNHPVLGLLSPSEFIPLLEHDDLIITLGEWVIAQVLRQLVAWQQAGFDLTIGVNISARQLHQGCFTARLNDLLAGYAPDVINRLEIEILETAALEDINAVTDAIKKCHALGIKVAIDDFGTGFSSLAHLKQLPIDVLKIDQSFVIGMLHNPDDFAIVSGIVGLASSFRRRVIAEGVESIEHILMLRGLGCDLMQGYGIARPMSAEWMLEWLGAFEPDPLWGFTAQSACIADVT